MADFSGNTNVTTSTGYSPKKSMKKKPSSQAMAMEMMKMAKKKPGTKKKPMMKAKAY